ncbi:DNA primase [Nonlabens ulvanivorans]|nr:DNA primase [Nonlabens ulvanivorans]
MDGKMIFVKSKDETVSTYTMDAILNFRRLMIEEKIKALYESISKDPTVDNTDVLSTVRTIIN